MFGSHHQWGDAGSTPAERKLVAQWESAYAERDTLLAAFFTGRPSGRSAALQVVRRGFNPRPLHHQQLVICPRSPTGHGRRPPKAEVAGSNPAGDTTFNQPFARPRASRRLTVTSRVVQVEETAASKTAQCGFESRRVNLIDMEM